MSWGVLLLYLLLLGIIIVANLGVSHHGWRLVAYGCLALLNATTISLGLLVASMPFLLQLTRTPVSPGMQVSNLGMSGGGLVITGALGFACLAAPFRRLLADWLPIDPGSPVHATALVFLIYMAATSLGVLLSTEQFLTPGTQVAAVEPGSVVLGQVIFTLFALTSVGLGIRRNVRQTLTRLDLRAPTPRQLGLAAAMIGVFLALDLCTSHIWHRLWPTSYETVMQASQRLFAGFASPLGALVLALSAGIGEEILFRGALQPRLGTPLTALAFALGHVQYALSPATVEILIISVALGWLRQRSNTTICMAVHIGYDFLNALLMPLLP